MVVKAGNSGMGNPVSVTCTIQTVTSSTYYRVLSLGLQGGDEPVSAKVYTPPADNSRWLSGVVNGVYLCFELIEVQACQRKAHSVQLL
jgi:hypothetical protein